MIRTKKFFFLQNDLGQYTGKTSALGLFVESQDVDGLKYSIFFYCCIKMKKLDILYFHSLKQKVINLCYETDFEENM